MKKIILLIFAVLLVGVIVNGIFLQRISREDAIAIANKIENGEITEVELEDEVYEVEFQKENKISEVIIESSTGKVLDIKDDDNEPEGVEDLNEKPKNTIITLEEAKEIAIKELGGKATDSDTKIVKGKKAWEIELRVNEKEADVLIDMKTGEILLIDWE